jgi:branched-chain amino acid transport system permease protein
MTTPILNTTLSKRPSNFGIATLARLAASWRVPLSVLALCALPWLLPSEALAVNVLIYGTFAVGYNLLFGYTGLLSFGHAAFFGAGAYLTGMSIVHFDANWLAALASGAAGSSVLAAVIGALSIGTQGVYFSMVTLALGQLVYYLALQASSWTGGENGLRGFTVSKINLFGWQIDFLNPLNKFYIVLTFTALALWLASRVLNSSFGAAIEAIRESEERARACGYDIERSKLLAFVLSGGICGLAGGLLALHLSIVPLDTLNYQTSGLVVMMTLLGGKGSFFGPFIGALAFLVMEDLISLWTGHWQLFVGAIFILFVLYMPKGIWGAIVRIGHR